MIRTTGFGVCFFSVALQTESLNVSNIGCLTWVAAVQKFFSKSVKQMYTPVGK
jgi:hypothetical protein